VGVLDVGMDLWTDVMVFSVVDLGCCYDRCCCRLRKRLAEVPLMEFLLLLLLLMMNIFFLADQTINSTSSNRSINCENN
jgi:hypothetical protein